MGREETPGQNAALLLPLLHGQNARFGQAFLFLEQCFQRREVIGLRNQRGEPGDPAGNGGTLLDHCFDEGAFTAFTP